ncbi:MAG: hypothetical protein SFY70_04625 [Bacteroidia bacterium]|nr:hypothetical protein [Bacteroidia bacterium]
MATHPTVARLALHNLVSDAGTVYGRGATPFRVALHAQVAHGVVPAAEALGQGLARLFCDLFAVHLRSGLAERLVVLAAPPAVPTRAAEQLTDGFRRELDAYLRQHTDSISVGASLALSDPLPSDYELAPPDLRQQYWAQRRLLPIGLPLAGAVVVIVDQIRLTGAKEAFLTQALTPHAPESLVYLYGAAGPRTAPSVAAEMGHALRRTQATSPEALAKLVGGAPVAVSAWWVARLVREFTASEWATLFRLLPPAFLTDLVAYLQQPTPPAEGTVRNLYLVAEAALQQRRRQAATKPRKA